MTRQGSPSLLASPQCTSDTPPTSLISSWTHASYSHTARSGWKGRQNLPSLYFLAAPRKQSLYPLLLLENRKHSSPPPQSLCHLQPDQALSVQFSSVTQSCLTLGDPMDCSTPGLHVHHQLLEFTQTHVH